MFTPLKQRGAGLGKRLDNLLLLLKQNTGQQEPRTVAHVLRQFIAQQQQCLTIEIGKHQIRPQLAVPVNFLQRSTPEFEMVLKSILFGIVSCAIHRDRVALHSQCRCGPKPQ